jgi:hypothetical protein
LKLFTMKKSTLRAIALATLLALTPAAGGCFGSFKLTRAIYGFNKDISSEKFIRWLVFLGLSIIPVYAIGGLGDILIFNTIDFWVNGGAVATRQLSGDEELVLAREAKGVSAELRFMGQVRARWFIEDLGDGLALRDEHGTPLAVVRDAPDGALQILDAEAPTARSVDAQTVSEEVARHLR